MLILKIGVFAVAVVVGSIARAELLSCTIPSSLDSNVNEMTVRSVYADSAEVIGVSIVSSGKSKIKVKSSGIVPLAKEVTFSLLREHVEGDSTARWYVSAGDASSGVDFIQLVRAPKKKTEIWFYHVYSRNMTVKEDGKHRPPDYTYVGTCE